MQYKPGDILLDKYRIEKLVGEGAFAEVYLATHIELNVPRALKILRKEAPGVGSTEFEDFQERFKLEVQLGARINHPNVVQVHDFEREGDTLILVMEYCPGCRLAERIRLGNENNNLIPINEAVKIGIDTASGLGAVHALDAVHRDLKPNNILFDKNQRAKVADLGLAQIPGGPSMRSKLSQPAPHPGTPGYMSPEQDKSSAYLSPASDIYSLGLMLFELLTGRVYRGQRPGTRPSQMRAKVPAWLDDLITQMLSLEPDARPWDGSETASLLRQGLTTDTLQNRSDLAPVAAAAQPPRPSPANQKSEQAGTTGGLPFDLSVLLKNRPLLFAVGGLLLLFVLSVFLVLSIIGGNWLIRRYGSDTASLDATPTAFKQAVLMTETRLARATAAWTNTPSVTTTNTPTITPTIDPNKPPLESKAGDTWISPIDGATMVFIPGGEFLMGSADSVRNAYSNEKPQHKVNTDAFWMDQTEVTNDLFVEFLNAEGLEVETPDLIESDIVLFWFNPGADITRLEFKDGKWVSPNEFRKHPVVEVTWYQASDFCTWAGKRLPTETEWEKAAKGLDERIFPWGNETISNNRANICDANCEFDHKDKSIDDGYSQTSPVGSYPQGASPYGIFDLAGNVWEWVADWYASGYYQSSPVLNPLGPEIGEARVMRGGSWNDRDRNIHTTHRGWALPDNDQSTFGFRCVLSP